MSNDFKAITNDNDVDGISLIISDHSMRMLVITRYNFAKRVQMINFLNINTTINHNHMVRISKNNCKSKQLKTINQSLF